MKVDFIYQTEDKQKFLITGNIKSKTDYTTTFEVSKGNCEGLLFFILMEEKTQVFEYSDKYSICVPTSNISWLGLPWVMDCQTNITELNK